MKLHKLSLMATAHVSESEFDSNLILVDETTSESSDEIILFDQHDLVGLDAKCKWCCEIQICHLYGVYRSVGEQYALEKNESGYHVLNTDAIDSKTTREVRPSLKVAKKQILKALDAFNACNHDIRRAAASVSLTHFDFAVLLLDYVWMERDKCSQGYSLVPLAAHVNVDREHMRLLGGIILDASKSDSQLLQPSMVSARTLCEPLELLVMLVMLLARMYNWPIAQDFDRRWSEIDKAPMPSDDEPIETVADFMKISNEVVNELKMERSSSVKDDAVDCSLDNAIVLSEQLVACIKVFREELETLVPAQLVPKNPPQVPQKWNSHVESSRKEAANQSAKPPSQKKTQQSKGGDEEISVVAVSITDNFLGNAVHIDDPVKLSSIPIGSFCLARPQKALNFIRCQVITQISPREYRVLFDDGAEQVVDISRIAIKIAGNLRIWEGVRVCAIYEPKLQNDKFKKAFYSGIIGVGTNASPNNEFLIFFDNGCDSLVPGRSIHLIAEQMYKAVGKKEVIDRRNNWMLMSKSRQAFIKHYLNCYPDWPLVPMKRKENTQRVNVMQDGKPHSAYVLRVERQFALLRFPNPRINGAACVATPCFRHEHNDEWVYRGSERLDAVRQTIDKLTKIERQQRAGVATSLMRSRREARLTHNVEYAIPLPIRKQAFSGIPRRNANQKESQISTLCPRGKALLGDNESTLFRRQTARKGGIVMSQSDSTSSLDSTLISHFRIESNIITYPVPDWSTLQQSGHSRCSVSCSQRLDKDPYDKRFLSYSPYMVPLLAGWTRQIATLSRRAKAGDSLAAFGSAVVYKAPCGVRLYKMSQISQYLRDTCSRLTIDLFTFDRSIRPNIVYQSPEKAKLLSDITNGYEAVPIPVYNEVDSDPAPKMEYDSRRYPYDRETDVSTINANFCSGCSCIDDCSDESTCQCRRLTRNEVSRLGKSLQPSLAKGYTYRNLAYNGNDESFLSGLYECNEKCQCNRNNCHNRVVQQKSKIPLELFKTEVMGWGVRSKVDIPPGAFLYTYAGAVLTDGQAETQGQTDGDEYFADINLVENVEREKRNAGVDLGDPNDGYYTDDDEFVEKRDSDDETNSSDEQVKGSCDSGQDSYSMTDDSDLDAEATYRTKKRTKRRRSQSVSSKDTLNLTDMDYAGSALVMSKPIFVDETILDSDDVSDEAAQPIGPPCGRFDVLKYMEDESRPSLFTIDAKRKGNLGRFFNHSCEPNLRTQLVFVDTHDLRLPWIALFTIKKIHAGQELFWDYGYSEGTVDGKQLECHCGSRFCRKRLL